ncbi:hypothetical protein BDV28DRAFT_154473 [Aspergillus coremiiformis]|uniref:Actin cytoskeleton-regulatory complex protein END3 n=1 Tax=Aspergillus coremiiformis TaxID=138285 RepID=A0A5N6ZGJ6_9EURO|nr:hypothetical protein BDV28DRAFT_154473 [Aspergillus coremiiformis]
MADNTRHPNLNLTPEEKRVFYQLFQSADTTNLGVITGEVAVPFFEKTKLAPDTLGLIWQIADRENRGLLTPSGFGVVLRLIGHAQAGRAPSEELALQPGPLPRFDGIQVDTSAPTREAGATSPPSTPAASIRVPPLNPDDVNKFLSLFEKSDVSRTNAIMRARLPNEILGRIWNLADTKQRGALDTTEFIIAMHLLTSYKSAAARRHASRGSISSRPGLDVPPSPINRPFGSPLSAQSTGADWLVTPHEKAQFDSIFATIDSTKIGKISGDQAETLAQIWDLADIDADGQLTKDEFAVAMYLVRQQRTLIPPSMRRRSSAQLGASPIPAQATGMAQAPAPAPAPAVRSAADDLFAPSQVPQSTGGSNVPFPMPASPTSKPFIPTSSFGQSLQPQTTGASSGVAPPARAPPSPSDDLLGDNDPEESNKLTQETTELANLSNQIGSLANEMQNELSQTSQQKRDFEARLAQARTMYEQELKNFKSLEERLHASKDETSKLQQEYAMLEGSRQDLQNQYDQVSAALTSDQQENASLKEKIRQANTAIAQLKPALEKARSEARQQKGLAAINKKQLATVEGERDKLREEMDGLSKEQPYEPDESVPVASGIPRNTNPFFKRQMTGSSESNALSPEVSNDQQRTFDSLFGPSLGSPVTTATPPPPTSFRADSHPTSINSATSGIPTPSGSPPPAAAFLNEPPAPPQSRQLTPNVLPFGELQSATSSTMVSPPASRYDTPAQSTTSQAGANEAGSASAPAFDDTEEVKQKFPEIPGAPEQFANAALSPFSEEKPEEKKDPSFDELFGGPAHHRSKSQKENDFEEAFAAMKQGPGPQKTNGAPAASEFPPIHEIDDDEDDDDSTDSEGPMGFDDNFTPVAPPQSQIASKPPAADSQISPPKYEESVHKEAAGNVPEFNSLLPKREDPTAFPDAPHSVESSTGAPIVHGEPQRDALKDSAAPPSGKASAPDFEAAFAGLSLAPAKESEDDDDFETPGNKNNEDFNFSFDSPSQRKPPSPGPNHGNVASSDFFNFDTNVSPSSPGGAAATADSAAKLQSHDWETLFAPLDNVQTPGGANGTSNVATSPSGPNNKSPGWALQTGTEDDQILQRLTGMGFPRDESLAALEKFDYDLAKVNSPLSPGYGI